MLSVLQEIVEKLVSLCERGVGEGNHNKKRERGGGNRALTFHLSSFGGTGHDWISYLSTLVHIPFIMLSAWIQPPLPSMDWLRKSKQMLKVWWTVSKLKYFGPRSGAYFACISFTPLASVLWVIFLTHPSQAFSGSYFLHTSRKRSLGNISYTPLASVLWVIFVITPLWNIVLMKTLLF